MKEKNTPTKNPNPFSGVKSIGIVCIDDVRLAPVAAVLLRDHLKKSSKENIRSIFVDDAGYKRTSLKISNTAIGYLQRRGFKTVDLLEPKRVDKYWLTTKDLVLTMDKFIRRNLLYDFFPTKVKEWGSKILVLTDAAGIKERIRDPMDDYNADFNAIYALIDKCLINIVKKLEEAN